MPQGQPNKTEQPSKNHSEDDSDESDFDELVANPDEVEPEYDLTVGNYGQPKKSTTAEEKNNSIRET